MKFLNMRLLWTVVGVLTLAQAFNYRCDNNIQPDANGCCVDDSIDDDSSAVTPTINGKGCPDNYPGTVRKDLGLNVVICECGARQDSTDLDSNNPHNSFDDSVNGGSNANGGGNSNSRDSQPRSDVNNQGSDSSDSEDFSIEPLDWDSVDGGGNYQALRQTADACGCQQGFGWTTDSSDSWDDSQDDSLDGNGNNNSRDNNNNSLDNDSVDNNRGRRRLQARAINRGYCARGKHTNADNLRNCWEGVNAPSQGSTGVAPSPKQVVEGNPTVGTVTSTGTKVAVEDLQVAKRVQPTSYKLTAASGNSLLAADVCGCKAGEGWRSGACAAGATTTRTEAEACASQTLAAQWSPAPTAVTLLAVLLAAAATL